MNEGSGAAVTHSLRFLHSVHPLLVSVRHSSSPIVVSSLRPTREAAPPAGKECRETT